MTINTYNAMNTYYNGLRSIGLDIGAMKKRIGMGKIEKKLLKNIRIRESREKNKILNQIYKN